MTLQIASGQTEMKPGFVWLRRKPRRARQRLPQERLEERAKVFWRQEASNPMPERKSRTQLHPFQKLSWRNNRDAKGLTQRQQVFVEGEDTISPGAKSSGEIGIVFGVPGPLLS